jgi:hypothetical protein
VKSFKPINGVMRASLGEQACIILENPYTHRVIKEIRLMEGESVQILATSMSTSMVAAILETGEIVVWKVPKGRLSNKVWTKIHCASLLIDIEDIVHIELQTDQNVARLKLKDGSTLDVSTWSENADRMTMDGFASSAPTYRV